MNIASVQSRNTRRHALRLSILGAALLLAAQSAQAAVSLSNGVLTVDTGSAPANAKIESLAFQTVRLYGVPGAVDGAAYFPVKSIRFTSGGGFDKVDFAIESAAALDISVDTGAGDAEVKVQWKQLAAASGNSKFAANLGGSGNNKLEFDYESFANSTTLGFGLVSSGDTTLKTEMDFKNTSSASATATVGVLLDASRANQVEALVDSENQNTRLSFDYANADAVGVKVISDDPSNRLDLSYRSTGTAGSDRDYIEVLSRARTVNLGFDLAGGDSFDENKVTVSQIDAATINMAYNNDAGAGDDLQEVKIVAEQSTVKLSGRIDGRDGDDFALVESSASATISRFALAGDAGNDKMSLLIPKGTLASGTFYDPSLLGGDGDDHLMLLLPGAYTGVGSVPGSRPFFDGGNGTDLCDGFGEFENCETIL